MQFVDLKSQYLRIEKDVQKRVLDVLENQKYIMGPEVTNLEAELAEYVGVKHVLGCSSGTDALVIPLMGFELSSNDAVFVPSFTFFASAEAITLAGGTPVFVDSEYPTFNISIESLKKAYERVLKEGKLKPRGVIAVDLFGQPADYDAITQFAEEKNLFLLEDAAQGFGSTFKGKKACSFGNVAATSFFPAKPLGCYGDGGAIFTGDDGLADLYHSIRVHGQGSDKYDNVRIGLNGRLDSIQAAVILAKLKIFDSELEMRQHVAERYTQLLQDWCVTPHIAEGCVSAWAQYTVMAENLEQREAILSCFKEKGLPIACYYPIPVHLSTAYKHLNYSKGDLPVCESAAERVFSLPMHPYLDDSAIKLITNTVKEILS